MHEMSGTDASFLYFETPSSHMHVLGTIVVDTTDVPGGWGLESVVGLIEQRLDLLPPFRQRIVPATLRLHHPVWVDVPDVDVRSHVARAICKAPGGMAELADEVSAFAEQQLDRSRPLWEALVVEGMADGRAALVVKVHHCAVDGVGAARILGSLFDLTREGRSPADLDTARAEARALAKPEPGILDVALHTATGFAVRPLKLAALLPEAARSVTKLVRHRSGDSDTSGGALPFAAPRAPFNGRITPTRVVAYADIAVDDVKAVKAAVGGTFNDAVIAISGGAFRHYLQQRDELPEASLIAVVPVSVRAPDGDAGGNRVSAMFTTLATDVEDPLERLKLVQQANSVGKGDQAALGNELLAKVGDLAPPNTTSFIARAYSALRLADLHPVVHNVVVSNVAGPPIPIYMAGAPVEGLYPLGPVLEGPGLNVTIVSYRDRVGIGLIACRDALPDLADLADAYPVAVEELLAAIR